MGSRYEMEVTITSAKDLKNVNWRNGSLRPYAVVWVDPNNKCSSRVDEEGDASPYWDQTLVIPLPPGPIEDHTLFIDIVHAGSEHDTKPLVGSAKLKLREVLDDVGFGDRAKRSLQLKRPSGRPHGKVDVKVGVRQPQYRAPDSYYAPPHSVAPPPSQGTRDYYAAPPAYGNPYAGAPSSGYPYAAGGPPSGYPYSSPTPPYGQQSYGAVGQQSYGAVGQQPVYVQQEEKKKSKFGGMGTGLAVGAVAGALGGLALAEGFDALEDKVADDAAEKVEDDLGYGDDEDY